MITPHHTNNCDMYGAARNTFLTNNFGDQSLNAQDY